MQKAAIISTRETPAPAAQRFAKVSLPKMLQSRRKAGMGNRAMFGATAIKLNRFAGATPELPLAAVDGWQINVANLDHAVKAIAAAASRGDGFAVFTLNLDHLVKLRRSSKFRRAYAHARFVTADGAPVARLAAQQNALIERTTGADLVVPLAEAAARLDLPVYLFGSTGEVLARAARDLKRCAGNLEIVGEVAPLSGFDPEGPEADAAIARIEASGARLCFVALGAPKQEIFAARAVARGTSVGFLCVGAALDFLAGSQSRAPRFMQSTGLEWLWRLANNPRRMASRYLPCALLLAEITLSAPVRGLLAGLRAL